ncbi:DUF1360 domain-containing protein [Mesobacillus foraminis]|uniref:Uncharacterized protein DUF1360 n=1 Tax=Mesobacillus foraminis TaxID=279826 RepID=A0A4R2BPB7_9BACI|nr:DUF1360 domain-containing protein [Mesobacillus foraminis]TCN27824.1 uncharacterized protein DUF1360 [Mesobacillus foraminis]
MDISIGLEHLLIVSLASFRLTRLIVFDKITEWIRSPFFDEVTEEGEFYLVPKEKGIRKWIGELLNCYWCTGIWSSALLFGLYVYFPIVGIPLAFILSIAAIAACIETVISKLMG